MKVDALVRFHTQPSEKVSIDHEMILSTLFNLSVVVETFSSKFE